ncbi:hypothetical protein HPB48_015963 [Haemaphysalis longicornis]|uniref:DUF4371 domain-containing protein n=1 Tax=Haemaphysalis longicornis TaxID=44386 RepID=A0A9J6FRV6_HAELO|nr:hypothetical protein HPB48_015963 [Haemaphysalis longicornis]
MKRAKCASLLKYVLYPHFKSDLAADVAEGKFSIIIDESTDISVTKFLFVAIIYYSAEKTKIVTSFLSLCVLETCTANVIVEAIKHVLEEFRLNGPWPFSLCHSVRAELEKARPGEYWATLEAGFDPGNDRARWARALPFEVATAPALEAERLLGINMICSLAFAGKGLIVALSYSVVPSGYKCSRLTPW